MKALGSENPPPTFFSIFLIASGPLSVTFPPESLRSQASQAPRWMSATENWSPVFGNEDQCHAMSGNNAIKLYVRE